MQDAGFAGLVRIKIEGGIPGPVEKSQQHEECSPAEQGTAAPTVFLTQDFWVMQSFAAQPENEPPQFAEQGNNQQRARSIRQHAAPPDNCKWTIRQAHVIDQEDANQQQHAADHEKLSETLLTLRRESHVKLHQGQQQRKVARVRHMHVRVHLGAAVLQKTTNASEGTAYALRIPNSSRVRGGQKRLASTSSILMENEHRKNIA